MTVNRDGSVMTALEEARFVDAHPEMIRSNKQWRELVKRLADELEQREDGHAYTHTRT